jgi:uncharacterized protein YceH (UPF0502 family)
MRLSAEEARVLGSLVEKELTTPDQYPLTIKSLVSACNQATNRDPVVAYDEQLALSTLNALKEQRLVRFVLPSHGRTAVRYRHVLDEALALTHPQCALVAVLLLRGPQTIGELRLRTERMTNFDNLGEIDHELRFLSSVEEPLAVNLGRAPGQKEERWSCPLVGSHDAVAPSPDLGGPTRAIGRDFHDAQEADDWTEPTEDRGETHALSRSTQQRLDDLGSELTALRAAVSELRQDLDALRVSLGG